MKRDDPFEIKHRYEIARDGVMLSWFNATTSKPGSPEYETNKHILWADASVHRDHRRQGIGRRWIPLAIELMDRHGCTTLSMGTEEESGHAFLRWMGAEGKFSGAENRLKVSEVDLAMLRQWTEDRRAEGFRIDYAAPVVGGKCRRGERQDKQQKDRSSQHR